jgi:hypothetical protein
MVNKIKKILVVALCVVVLVGCASTPVPTDQAVSVPADRIFDTGKKFLSPSSDTGEVLIKRDSGTYAGGLCAGRIYVDGVQVADIERSEKIVLHLPEGQHVISLDLNAVSILCAGRDMTREVAAIVKRGGRSAFRFGIDSERSLFFQPTAF